MYVCASAFVQLSPNINKHLSQWLFSPAIIVVVFKSCYKKM